MYSAKSMPDPATVDAVLILTQSLLQNAAHNRSGWCPSSVPNSKIQAVIAFKILVVLVMTYRCIDPFTEPMTAETFWIQFVTKMTIYIVHDHEEKKRYRNEAGEQEW